MSQLRIFSYLPNPRIWKATIAARLNGVDLEIRGSAPKELQSWLWDFDAHPLAAQLAAGPTRAYGAAKRLMQSGFTESLETQIEMELRSVGTLARTEDARQAIAAFAAKRTPVFTGR